MDERTAGVTAPPEQIEHEIDRIRGDLTGVLGELDRRRHELLDWRLQLRRHRGAVVMAAAILAAATTGLILLVAWRRHREERFVARAGRLRDRAARLRLALARAVARPEEVARPEPGLARKLLTAGLAAAVGVFARSLAKRAVRSVDEQ